VSTPLGGRVCAASGLYLLPASGEIAFRIAQDRYVDRRGILSARGNKAVGRLPAGAQDSRGRYDTLGTTVYFADSGECAFAEVLQGFRKDLAPLALDAAAAGVPVDKWVQDVTDEAAALGVDAPWAISCDWQWNRSVFHVAMPIEGWWIAIDRPSTLATLTRQLPAELTALGVPYLTAGQIDGDDRAITTLLAEHVRGLILDDGSLPLGISFASKTLHGRCWAFWDRRTDDGLSPAANDPSLLRSTNVDTPEMRTIAAEYGLPILPGRPRY
jgi:RES domain-containing protein